MILQGPKPDADAGHKLFNIISAWNPIETTFESILQSRTRATLTTATIMRYSILAPILLASAARAWLPEDRDLAAFNQTARFEQLGKRFKPALPSGITKIRGVNFGGKVQEITLPTTVYQAHVF